MQISYFFKNHAKLYLQIQNFKDSFLFLLVKGMNKIRMNTIKEIQTKEFSICIFPLSGIR